MKKVEAKEFDIKNWIIPKTVDTIVFFEFVWMGKHNKKEKKKLKNED